MKKIAHILLWSICAFVSSSVTAQTADVAKELKKGDVLRLTYRFDEALVIFNNLLKKDLDSVAKSSVQREITLCENGKNMLKFTGTPKVIARETVPLKEFYGRVFAVGPGVLIPRPESEHLVEEALRLPEPLPEQQVRFLDMGVGSGCLAVTLLAERPAWRGVGVDISAQALEYARRNAHAHQVERRLDLLRTDFAQPGFQPPGDGFHLMVGNPPYISEKEYGVLDAAVRDFEPKSALVPGKSGLEHARAVVLAAVRLLAPGGLLLMEHGAGQGQAVRDLCVSEHWERVGTGLDLAGRERFLRAERRKTPLGRI